MRHQRSQGNHFHWEQPQNSQMLRLPYLQEVRQHLIALEIDLCTAGDLIDPDTKLHMRKALTIMTSSKSLFHDMCGLKCSGKHEHQEIEGSCHVNGKTMNRSSFSEKLSQKVCKKGCQVFMQGSNSQRITIPVAGRAGALVLDTCRCRCDPGAKCQTSQSGAPSKTE